MKLLANVLIALLTAGMLTACVDKSDEEDGTKNNPSEGASVQMQNDQPDTSTDTGEDSNAQ